MPKQEMKKIEEMTNMRTVKKGEYIYFPEDPSSSVYFLKMGRIKIGTYTEDGKEIIKTILWPGEIFGELGVIDESNRTDFAIAADDEVLICAMNMTNMINMMSMNPGLNLKVMKLIGLRFRKTERKLESLMFKDSRTRLVEFIKELAEERGIKVGTDISVKHYLTHQDFANLNAISRQNVTSIFNELKAEKQMHFERKSFLIRDINSLK